MGLDDFTKIPGVFPRRNACEVVYTVPSMKNKPRSALLPRRWSEHPAKHYGLYPRNGRQPRGQRRRHRRHYPGASHVLHGADMLSRLATRRSRASHEWRVSKSTCRFSCRWTAASSSDGCKMGEIHEARQMRTVSKIMDQREILICAVSCFSCKSAVFERAPAACASTAPVKSVLWLLLFGAAVAVSILFCFLGMRRSTDGQDALISSSGAGSALQIVVFVFRLRWCSSSK